MAICSSVHDFVYLWNVIFNFLASLPKEIKLEEDKRQEQKYHKFKPFRFFIVFMYYSVYKMRSKNKNKPPEIIIDWLNSWRAWKYWRDKDFLGSFFRVRIRDPYSYHCHPYKNIKNVMLAIRQPEN